MFDIMRLKDLFLLNCESSKYIAKLFSLSIYTILYNYFIIIFIIIIIIIISSSSSSSSSSS